MQARKLKKILNTGYIVSQDDEYIRIGSYLCHNLITVHKETLNVKYALDAFNEGISVLNKKEGLLGIWNKLLELIASGDIKDIIEKDDVITNKLPIYYVIDSDVIKTFTDKYGYPNVTISGYLMYNNEYFKRKKDAVKEAVKERLACIKYNKRVIENHKFGLEKESNELKENQFVLKKLKSICYKKKE